VTCRSAADMAEVFRMTADGSVGEQADS
jgi:hypothetical protein